MDRDHLGPSVRPFHALPTHQWLEISFIYQCMVYLSYKRIVLLRYIPLPIFLGLGRYNKEKICRLLPNWIGRRLKAFRWHRSRLRNNKILLGNVRFQYAAGTEFFWKSRDRLEKLLLIILFLEDIRNVILQGSAAELAEYSAIRTTCFYRSWQIAMCA